MKGPFPIIDRGHSGGRLLCEAFRQNGFWMGLSENSTRDAKEFAQRNPAVRYLVEAAFRYPDMPEAEKGQVRQKMRELVESSKNNCPNPEAYVAYGWKRAITTFTVQIFLDALPEAKTIHLIRDGRDLMLSRLNARMKQLDDPFNKLAVFGDANISEYRGKPLTWKVIKAYRNEIEMEHWVTAVRFGMRGRMYSGRYMEIFYEDLCRHPVETLAKVFEFLDVPFKAQAREWASQNASVQRIGKWKDLDPAIIDNAIKIGEPLLKELGYS